MVNYSSTLLDDLNNEIKRYIEIFKNTEYLKLSYSQFLTKFIIFLRFKQNDDYLFIQTFLIV